MRRPLRQLAGGLCAIGVFAALAYPCFWAYLYCLRAGYVTAEWVGVMDTARGLGGQVAGHNYYRYPEWAHWPIGGLAAAVSYAPAIVLAVITMRWVSGSSRVTRCGACGRAVTGATGPVCPHCRAAY